MTEKEDKGNNGEAIKTTWKELFTIIHQLAVPALLDALRKIEKTENDIIIASDVDKVYDILQKQTGGPMVFIQPYLPPEPPKDDESVLKAIEVLKSFFRWSPKRPSKPQE